MVYQNIFESDYYYDFGEYRLYFSSLFNRRRFRERIEEFIFDENIKLSNKYGIKIDLTNYFVIVLYKKIEKRGFRVYNKDILVQENKMDWCI